MAGCTFRRRTRKTTGVTSDTIRCDMSACQRKARLVMVKIIICTARRMTSQTCGTIVSITIYTNMLIIGFRIGVAGYTSEFCIIRRIGVAINTLAPFPVMCSAVNGEIISIMIHIICRCPAGISGMAFRTTG